jgi:hypothetical protein
MNTYTENITLGEFETIHTLTQTITPRKSANTHPLLLELMHFQRPLARQLIIQTTDRYKAGRLVTYRDDHNNITPDLYLTREVIETAARLIKADYGARTPSDTFVARIDWTVPENNNKNQSAVVSLNNGTQLNTGEIYGQVFPALGKLFVRPTLSEEMQPAEAFTIKAEALAGLAKLTTPDRPKRGAVEWATFTPTTEEGARRPGALLFTTSGVSWSMDYLAQPLATPVADLAPQLVTA